MEDIPIIILTHKRWGRVTTLEAVSNCILCVTESQVPMYKEHYPNVPYLIHPDSIVGYNAKVDWVMQNGPKEWFCIDDDFKCMRRVWCDPSSKPEVTMSAEECYEVIQQTYRTAKDMGARAFCFNKSANPLSYDALKPFSLTGGIICGYIGFINGFELEYDPEDTSNIDYFWSGINAYKYRYLLMDNRFSMILTAETFKTSGGMAEFRTLEAEKKDTILLKKWFGDAIVVKSDTKIRKRTHQYEKTLRVRF